MQNIQMPLFAPASQRHADDFDLNEVFAEYFINEFDDPMNAYTSSMANFSGATAAASGLPPAVPMQNAVTAAPSTTAAGLPTGGIKTAFHNAASQPAVQQQQLPLPDAKRAKVDGATGSGQAAAPSAVMVQAAAAQMAQQQHPVSAAAAIPVVAGTAQPGVIHTNPDGTHVALPVGVGIRLGGIGGIAPQMAARGAGAGQFMWGGAGDDVEGMGDQAVAERRQRNREHAKRSRVRKKFMLESLQEEVRDLQKENARLRMLVQEHVPEHAMQIISDCCIPNPLFSDEDRSATLNEAQEDTRKAEPLVKSDFTLIESLAAGQQCFCLSDPKLPDNPIVFASPGFYSLTGYTSKEVLGRNCRFLQGPGTNSKAVEIIRKAIATGSDATVCLLNYKADGTPFWNQFFIAALRDSDNNIVNFVGVQTKIEPEAGANALEDRVNAVLPLAEKGDEGKEEEQE